jgi:hypothetical protein
MVNCDPSAFFAQMVIPLCPFPLPTIPSEYSTHLYPSFMHASRKRKRDENEMDEDISLDDRFLKKRTHERNGTSTSLPPPSTITCPQPSFGQDIHQHGHNPTPVEPENANRMSISDTYCHRPENEHEEPRSLVNDTIPSQNLFLRDLHMEALAHQYDQHRLREEMWREEERTVAERYSQMNRILGSRRQDME